MSGLNYKENFAMIKLMLIMTLILGGVYPFMLTVVGRVFFPFQAQGSLIQMNQQVVGSLHMGQEFISPKYFKGRPSLTHYQTDVLQPQHLFFWGTPELSNFVALQRQQWSQTAFVPNEMLYPSASMLDPHISWMGGVIQLASVARARGMDINDLYRFLDSYSHSKDMINVLDLNLALDKEFSHT